jgi:hypothetical protein
MDADRPWRLEDMKFHDQGGKRRSVLGPVVVVESGGKYSVTMARNHMRLSWNDLEEKQVGPALDAAFAAFNATSG